MTGSQQHQLKISPIQYPGGLRIVECETCRYAFAAEINEVGMLQQETKVQINEGDLDASHSLFQVPTGPLVEISINAEI
jgi:hypothetical protein